mmetsp:Transcript_8552/g.35653  ORF Transcript_8552/g.35653 Transcript_8552/m.35653 type:complete len:246 (-) Transcript_8552:27-764(-)
MPRGGTAVGRHQQERQASFRGGKRGVGVRGAQGQEERKKKNRPIKAQVRSLQRLLQKEGLPEEVRAAKSEQLQELLKQQQAREKELKRIEREKRLQKKYRRLKFVERQKLTRKMGQCQKKIMKRKVKLAAKGKETDKKLERLEAAMEELQSDLLYIKHFPKNKKYVALFPEQDSEKAAEQRAKLKVLALRNYEEEQRRLAENPDAEPEEEDEAEPSSVEESSSEGMDESSDDGEEAAAPKDDFFL